MRGPLQVVGSYRELLGAPFRQGGMDLRTGLDCRGLCSLVLSMSGLQPPPGAFPTDAALAQDLPQWIAKASAAENAPWLLLGRQAGCASRVGDIIYSCPDGRLHHIDVLVVPQAPKLALSAHRRHGVRAVPLSRISGVLGVYRLAGA